MSTSPRIHHLRESLTPPLEPRPSSLDFSLLTSAVNRGEELIITATGHTSEDIEDGAYVLLQVKYGLIRLISTTADLCEQITNVDLTCPIEKGDLAITKSVALPAEIPPVSD